MSEPRRSPTLSSTTTSLRDLLGADINGWPVQRLCLLHRDVDEAGRRGPDYAGVMAVLHDECICVVIVMSHDADGTSVTALQRRSRHLRLERGAYTFPTLDAASSAVDALRTQWRARGWTELST